jgi:hypothetical protein
MEERREKIKKERETLIAFLKRTREGEYAPIEESSLPYTRIKEETESIEVYEEEYYYGVS